MKTLALLSTLLLLAQDKAPEGATILDASQFVHEDGKACSWPAAEGVLEVGKGSVMTKEKYTDFQLHVEFNLAEPPEGAKDQGRSNSGVYIQRRYEVQILDSMADDPPKNNGCASIYTQKAPDKNVGKKPGEWQTYDITFTAPRFDAEGNVRAPARVTVLLNGVKVQDDFELYGATVWRHRATYQAHGPTGPLALQDHGHPVRYRNIWFVPLKEGR